MADTKRQLSTEWTLILPDLATFLLLKHTQLSARDRRSGRSHLSHHAVPRPVDLLAVFPVGDQVKVVGELDRLGDLLQDVDAEALAAALDVNARLLRLVTAQERQIRPSRSPVLKSGGVRCGLAAVLCFRLSVSNR